MLASTATYYRIFGIEFMGNAGVYDDINELYA